MIDVTIGDVSFQATKLFQVVPDAERVLLEVKDRRALEQLAGIENPPLIGEDGVAASPLEKYPGEIRFKPEPTGRTFKAIYAAIKPRPDDPDVPRARLVLPYWRAIRAACEVRIETPAGDVVTAATDVDDVPAPVLDWAALCLQEYDANFLRSGI